LLDLINDFLRVHIQIIHKNPLWASLTANQSWYSHNPST
jgi:hypothetical protein